MLMVESVVTLMKIIVVVIHQELRLVEEEAVVL